LKIQLLVLWTF